MKLLGVVFSALGAGLSKILVGTILSGSSPHTVVKPSQNKKGGKNFQLHRFFEYFFSAASCKKVFQKRCSWKIFWPFLFWPGFSNITTTLIQISRLFYFGFFSDDDPVNSNSF